MFDFAYIVALFLLLGMNAKMNRILSRLFAYQKLNRWCASCLSTQLIRAMSMENIEVSHVMMPDDANIAGNVHGGTILKLIEEAGVIIATRHCNQGNHRIFIRN